MHFVRFRIFKIPNLHEVYHWKAGIKVYDVILKFGDVEIDNAAALSNAVAKQKIGSKVKVRYKISISIAV